MCSHTPQKEIRQKEYFVNLQPIDILTTVHFIRKMVVLEGGIYKTADKHLQLLFATKSDEKWPLKATGDLSEINKTSFFPF